jgi:hypothetical protein
MAESLYEPAIQNMSATVHQLALLVPPPQEIPFADSFAYRYVEKTIQQAIVQKLARYVTTLRATFILLEYGFLQEQASLQRILDEIQEDVTFLSYALIVGEVSELHRKYLDAFYQEELDPTTGKLGEQDRPMVPRKKIRAYIANAEGANQNPSQGVRVSREISKAYSGFIHAASPQVMDMYFGTPPRFHLGGMRGTFRQDEHREDVWNYFYRGILVFSCAAQALGNAKLCEDILFFAQKFAQQAGKDYGLKDRSNQPKVDGE